MICAHIVDFLSLITRVVVRVGALAVLLFGLLS
jgi:hypothetical protein